MSMSCICVQAEVQFHNAITSFDGTTYLLLSVIRSIYDFSTVLLYMLLRIEGREKLEDVERDEGIILNWILNK